MPNTDPEDMAAAQLAYERSNASLKDYNPNELDPEERVGEPEAIAPKEPVLAAADNLTVKDVNPPTDNPVAAKTTDDSNSTTSKSSSK